MADQELWRKNIPADFEGRMGEHWDDEIEMKPVIWSSVAVAVSFVFAVVFCWWLMDGVFARYAPEAELSPLAEANERRLPPTPWLQPKPEMELDDWLEVQQARADGYGWVDQLDNRIHIPIDEAMEMVLAQQGRIASQGRAPGSVEPASEGPVDVDAMPDPASLPDPAAMPDPATLPDPAAQAGSESGEGAGAGEGTFE